LDESIRVALANNTELAAAAHEVDPPELSAMMLNAKWRGRVTPPAGSTGVLPFTKETPDD
jgi:hypothetical protein